MTPNHNANKHMIPHSGMTSSLIRPLFGANSSRYIPLIQEWPTSRSSSDILANTSGKSALTLFQYPMPPFTQPMQLLFLYPMSYILGREKEKSRSNSPWTSGFESSFSIRGNSWQKCGIDSNNRSALFLSSMSIPQT